MKEGPRAVSRNTQRKEKLNTNNNIRTFKSAKTHEKQILKCENILKCQHCNTQTYMPFKCPYCNGCFCAEHRLPENHNCPEQWRAKIPQPPLQPLTEKQTQNTYEYTITYSPTKQRTKAKLISFSKKELQHLLIGTLLVMAVGISIMLENRATNYTIALILAALFTTSFIAHELAHKITAQLYGLWAEFRLTLFGAIITLISIISPLFKIISPGAVMISSNFINPKIIGKTAIAGPLTNIILSATFGTATLLANDPTTIFIASTSAFINAFMAVFNLIPFGIMDGFKIYWWNKIIWAITFATALTLLILTILFI